MNNAQALLVFQLSMSNIASHGKRRELDNLAMRRGKTIMSRVRDFLYTVCFTVCHTLSESPLRF